MFKRFASFFIILAFITTLLLTPEMGAHAFNPHYLVSDEDMTDSSSMTIPQIQVFLDEHGRLGTVRSADVYGINRPAAEIIWMAAQTFGISPKFLIVLLQREQSLITNNPTERRLAWAMGYAVCDDCSKDDPQIQKFKGFGNQVYYAASRIRESFLTDLHRTGTTLTGIGPGIPKKIDGITVIPSNIATAVLYTYTPHLHGNENFVKLWQKWFTQQYPTGSLLQNATDGSVWLIKYDERRLITSKTALTSRFDPTHIITVLPEILSAYKIGPEISFPNYSLLRQPNGSVFLLVDDTLRPIISMDAFRTAGFSTDEIVNVEASDLENYFVGDVITKEALYPEGILLQNEETGGIFFLENGYLQPVISKELLTARFPYWSITKSTTEDLEKFPLGKPVKFPDGTLVAAHGSPDVFVIAGGDRRLIVDEEAFFSRGWEFDKVIWTDERSVLLHPMAGELGPLEMNEKEIKIAF